MEDVIYSSLINDWEAYKISWNWSSWFNTGIQDSNEINDFKHDFDFFYKISNEIPYNPWNFRMKKDKLLYKT